MGAFFRDFWHRFSLTVRVLFEDLSTPERFEQDPGGFVSNQLAHIAVGFALVACISTVWFTTQGEMPFKLMAWLVAASLYLAWEIGSGWNGADSVEDWWFTCVYGSGGACLLFDEITPGCATLAFDLLGVVPLLGFSIAHLVYGASKRVSHE